MTNKMIYFDIDGTINNFYGVTDWLECILKEDTKPYDEAPCIVEENILIELVEKGYHLGIVSWLAKGMSKEYDKAVRKSKKEWLKKNYPNVEFDEIHIVKYGTPKYKVVKERNGFLFDDEEKNRNEWKGIALEPYKIFNFCLTNE